MHKIDTVQTLIAKNVNALFSILHSLSEFNPEIIFFIYFDSFETPVILLYDI